MDESHEPLDQRSLPLQGPHWKCPADLPKVVPGPACEALPADFRPLRLVLEAGGLTVEFTRPDMLVGRHSQADVRLPLPDVSRHHCRFLFRQGYWQVVDLQSLNGVYVNGEQIKEARLQDGDTLGIGSLYFKVRIEASQAHTGTRPPDAPDRGIIAA